MLKRRGFFLIFISLVMGGAAAWAANSWLNNRMMADEDLSTEELVVVAALDIPYGSKVEPRHVKVIKMPAGTAPPGVVREPEDIHGHVAKSDVLRGELIVSQRFATHEGGSTLAALVTKSMRAVTVRVDDVIGVAGFLLPGNRVDILATRLDRNKGASTRTILENIKVLAIDQQHATNEDDPVIVRAVTLEMTPDDSEVLVKAKEEGSIQLTLRNPGEVQVAKAAPPPPKPVSKPVARKTVRRPPSSMTVTLIKGTKVDRTKAKI